jgi:hypothetical protein
MPLQTADKLWVEDLVRTYGGRQQAFARRLNNGLSLDMGAQESPDSLPVVPVSFIDPYTDNFNSTSRLAAIKHYQCTLPARTAAGGTLSITGTAAASPMYAYCGQ